MIAIEKKSLVVGKYVSTQHVDKVIRNYKQERWVQNSERIGKEDSLSGWWSIEEMESFLEKAKMYGGDGVKFYFGAYDKDYQEQPEYAGRQTLVMVATKQKEGKNGTTVNKDIYINDGNSNNILAYNQVRLCPPSCGIGGDTESPEIGVTIVDRGCDGLMVI